MNVNLDNFETIVDPVIFDRGLKCKNEGAILRVEAIDNFNFNAVVTGSEHYFVNIALTKNGDLFTFDCTCPFNTSAICKHMVALLLFLKETKKEGIQIPKGDLFRISSVLDHWNKEELAQLLVNLAKSDNKAKDRILKELDLKPKKK